MSTQYPEQVVFEAGSVPRPRPAQKRLLSARCCLITLATVASIVGLLASYIIAKVAVSAFHHITTPYATLAHKSTASYFQESTHDLVRPLVDSSSYFDIRATVWLDVTGHLSQGKSLPANTQVAHYKQADGEKRSEAILYSDLLFTNVSMHSRQHSSARIRVPIEPLYSQDLGPSTLRATFQLVPHVVPPSELQLKASGSIYPSFLPIGPRSPHSRLLQQNNDIKAPLSLNDALELSAINVNLVTLLATKWRLNDTQYNLRDDYGVDPPMFDCSPSNRLFGNATTEGLYISDEHRIMIPNIKTRSRIILLKEDSNFTVSQYFAKLASVKTKLEDNCAPMQNKPFYTSADGKCQRPTNDAVFENLLHFTNTSANNASHEHFYYAPFLTQHMASAAPRHHRTLPRILPTASSLSHSHDTTDQCLVPMLETDDSHQFFEFDWDIFFSSHHHMRATVAETMTHTFEPKLQDYVENGTELRAQTSAVSDMQWTLQAFAFADQEHPNSKPWSLAWRLGLYFSLDGIVLILTTLYWYTRATSQGLSTRAQWLVVASTIKEVYQPLLAMKDDVGSFFHAAYSVVALGCTLIPVVVRIAVLLRLDFTRRGITRRPPTKKEKLSRRLDNRLGWKVPLTVFALQMAFITSFRAESTHILPAVGCFSPPKSDFATTAFRESLLHVLPAVRSSALVTQLIFNFYSHTYAGSFKLSAFADITVWTSLIVLERSEKIGGWQANRIPISIGDIFVTLVRLSFVYQAVIFPGIPQTMLEEDDDDL